MGCVLRIFQTSGAGRVSLPLFERQFCEHLASRSSTSWKRPVRTHGVLRYEISPKYRLDERWKDLLLCLELDGYRRGLDEYGREMDTFVSTEPAIEGVLAVEDDLTAELRRSGLPDADDISRIIENSADAFRRGDFNGCLSNARVALQTLATSIAKQRQRSARRPTIQASGGRL